MTRRQHYIPSQLIMILAAGAVLAVSSAVAAPAQPASPMREVNVTSDSPPGWAPSAEQEQQADKTARAYLAAVDNGDATGAYAFLADLNRRDQPFAAFSESLRAFNAEAGRVKERRILKVTWSKDPRDAPLLGVYAAVDLASQFADVDRHCGYLIFHQPASGGDFRLMREENNYMANRVAVEAERKQSRAEVDRAWTTLSARCPNYVPFADVAAQPPAPLPEATDSTIGYPSVAAALAGLRAKRGVVFSVENGWTIANDESGLTIWSFTPRGHPSHPAVVKRQLVTENGRVNLLMSVQCEADKRLCDDLVRTFQQLNTTALGAP